MVPVKVKIWKEGSLAKSQKALAGIREQGGNAGSGGDSEPPRPFYLRLASDLLSHGTEASPW